MRLPGPAIALGVAVISCFSGMATAGVFSVTPVRIHMLPKDRAVAVTITNDGDAPVALQADLFVWSQKADGTDELTLTEDLILAPPIIKLAPKAKQVVRLALLKPADASKQLTYRMIMREIPEAVAQKSGIQLPIALALSMPVFITPPPAIRSIACTAARDAAQGVQVSCANSGSAYAQVREIQLKRGEKTEARFEGGVYVLPGAQKSMSLKPETAGQSLAAGAARLVVSFDDTKVQTFDVTLP
ncbi:MAG: fimbria/pilus periplasmic chaperone [Betaproteobacteria bacterium]